ncbi:hypothetical protein PgNI_11160 [Pyricularia grisea]|uniref:FAD/NAD(P)-binding domain-containing protein n=1 Tax=Pyricularia grisea TaxID=148305 RepID=A0A6P8API8_PYRGI|nr:hypothetical protein PgNI_11160 [Pyricularia grisea]TLD03938.1 hypothetical protein PgNI_11160 [Pyricularia grisea]
MLHDDYLPAFNRDKIVLIGTEEKGIEDYADDGIIVNDKKLQVDMLIVATGFASANDFLTPHMGLSMGDFPSVFRYWTSGSGESCNYTSSLDVAARLAVHVISTTER